jgi:hypothetical protein
MKNKMHIWKIKLFAICLSIFGYSFGQNKNYSELGLNYFLNNIYAKDFTETKLEFSGRTESVMPEYLPNFKGADSIVQQIYKNPKISEKGISLKLNQSDELLKIKKHRGKNMLKLYVYPLVSSKEKHYVYIVIYKRYHFVEHYLIQLNDYGKEISYWNASEII